MTATGDPDEAEMMTSVNLRNADAQEPANDPFATPDAATAPGDAPSPNAGGHAHIVVPVAHGDDDEEVCGVCFETPPPGQLAKLLCCRNMLCLKDAQRVGTCPFCREEPMAWGLQ